MCIAIIGAGIGGLTAALACHDAGLDVLVYEQSAVVDEVGAGLQLGSNATRVLRALNVLDEVAETAVRPTEIQLRSGLHGNVVAVRPLGATSELRYGAPYLHIHRADLQRVLLTALHARGITVALGHRLTAANSGAGGVELEFVTESGQQRRVRAAVCIGADGLHSRVRAQLFGEHAPQFTGNVAWRATVPTEALPLTQRKAVATVWMGPGAHIVQYLVRGGARTNIVAVFEQPEWTREDWRDAGDANDMRRRFGGWHADVHALLSAVQECHLWALCDRPPMPVWGEGCVTLLGDACHPMLPFLAQGAAMAMEDAWVLARALHAASDAAAALRRYEALRGPRTARVQRAARRQAALFHMRAPAAFARDLVLRLGSYWLPKRALASFDWLYGHDVVLETQYLTGNS